MLFLYLDILNMMVAMLRFKKKPPGDVLHLINTSSAAIKFLNSEEFPLQHEEIYKKIVKDKQKEYNLQMQQKLLDAPQSFFDKLLADARLLAVKHEQPLNDLNAENIMFDQEKGFFFIDLEPYTFVHEEKPKRPTDFTIFKKVTWMLASMDNFYTNCEDDSVYMLHKKANKILISKLLNAVLNDYFIFSLEDFPELENIIKRHCASNDSEEIINTFKAQYFAKIKIF